MEQVVDLGEDGRRDEHDQDRIYKILKELVGSNTCEYVCVCGLRSYKN